MASSSRSLFTTNALVTVTLVVGFANNAAIAAIFGLTRRVDAFYAAQMFPNLFMVLCIDYLGKNFLPMFARAEREDRRLASELTSAIVTTVGLLSVGVVLVLLAASRPLFALLLPGFSAHDIVIVAHDFWIMSPALVLMAITAFHQYVCQHDERFARIAAIRAAMPVTNLATILIGSPFIGPYALPVGYCLGNAVVAVLMAREARYRYRWRVAIRSEWEAKVFSNSAIVMGTGLLARSRSVIMNYAGSLVGGGAISALAMANKLIEPLGRTFFTAARMWLFSRTARLAVNRDTEEIARVYDLGLGACFLCLTPVVWWLGLNSGVVVDVLFHHGQFNLRMGTLVSLALIGAAPSIVFTGVNALVSNAFYAMDRVLVPAVVMPVGTAVYLALVVLLTQRLGVLGLTLATSGAGVVVFAIMVPQLARQVPAFSARKLFLRVCAYALAGGVCFGLPALWLGPLAASSKLAAAGVSLVAGTALYVALLLLVRDPVLGFVWQYSVKAFRRSPKTGGAVRDAAR